MELLQLLAQVIMIMRVIGVIWAVYVIIFIRVIWVYGYEGNPKILITLTTLVIPMILIT